MGWKGAVRSVRAEIRRAEKQQIQYAKLEQAEQMRHLVQKQNEMIEEIRSIHKVQSKEVNWDIFINAKEPGCPERVSDCEKKAISAYENYLPGFFIKLLKLEQWRRGVLKDRIEKARILDEMANTQSVANFELLHNKWKSEKELAEKVYSGDLSAYEQVILGEPILTGGSLKCSSYALTFEADILVIEIDVLPDRDILPEKVYSVTKTGKLSEKHFAVTHYNQLYQDYVCSASLAVAKVILHIFPVDKVVINAMSEILNTSTGNLERQVLLSVLVPKNTLFKINFENIDPSDCMRNFNHRMNFKNTTGMLPTSALKIKHGDAS